MPLTEKVNFKTRLQRGNRIQVPKFVRWRYKLETDQILKVSIMRINMKYYECFFATMSKDGRIVVPKLVLEEICPEDPSRLEGYPLNVTIEPS